MALLKKKTKEKVLKVLAYSGVALALITILGLLISLIWVIPLTMKEDRIKRVVEDSPLFDDNYEIWNVKVYGNEAVAYVCADCRWAWNTPASEYVFYVEKENEVWAIKDKVMIWSG